MKKNTGILFVAIFTMVFVYACFFLPTIYNFIAKKQVEKIISEKYPSYVIYKIDLIYYGRVLWEHGEHDPEGIACANRAKAYIGNSKEKRNMSFGRDGLKWYISTDEYDTEGLEDDCYAVKIDRTFGNKDIDNFVKNGHYWVIPNEQGILYEKYNEENDDEYYIFYHYDAIKKTKGGRVYYFDRIKERWEPTEDSYLYKDYSSYRYPYRTEKQIEKEEAMKIIHQYSSYKGDE